LVDERPDLVLVQGDTNSTLAGALTATKLKIPVAHIEAGCRSFNKIMPEETNRILTDHCAKFLFAADNTSAANLSHEGLAEEDIYLVGSTLADACLRSRGLAESSDITTRLGVKKHGYALATLHRAENTGKDGTLRELLGALDDIAAVFPVVLPLHPRTKAAMSRDGIKLGSKIRIIEPLGYLDFIRLLSDAMFALTDSGGVQEEAVILDTPALIMRNETEWIEFVRQGKNRLVGTKRSDIAATAVQLIEHPEVLAKMIEQKAEIAKGASRKIVDVICQNN
jgi:UDP-N-acetylglucosamine 2-epimerase